MRRLRLAIVLGLVTLLLGGLAYACSVPVFRYALERWRHDKRGELYRVTLLHAGALTEEQLLTLRGLDPESGPRPNWFIDAVDLDNEPSDAAIDLWRAQPARASLPWVVVQAPENMPERPPLYQGPLDRAALTALFDSPTRQQIAQKLLTGDSVVWLLLESGDRDRDAAAADLARQQLDKLAKAIPLPPQDDDKDSVLRSKVPLRISFPLVRLARQAPGEEAFIQQLLTLEEDYTKTTGPILYPIFGRGRMLTGFADKEITARNLTEAARFLCAACSCNLKAANPGVDLLWRADWDSILDDGPPPPEPTPEPELVVIPKKPATVSPPTADPARMLLIGGISAAGVLVLITGWLALRLSRGV